MGSMAWTGTRDDREHTAGKVTHYALNGPAWHIAARIAEIIEASPGMRVEGTCMIRVMPPETDEERAAREAGWSEEDRD